MAEQYNPFAHLEKLGEKPEDTEEKSEDTGKKPEQALFGDFSKAQNNKEKWITSEEMQGDIYAKNNQTQENEVDTLMSVKDASLPIEYNEDGSIKAYNEHKKEDEPVVGGTDFGAKGISKHYESNIDEKEQEKLYLGDLVDSPLLPVVNGLNDSGYIDIDEYNEVVEKLLNSDKESHADIIEKLVGSIPELDSSEKKNILEGINGGKEITEENFEESVFYKSYTSVETGKKPEGNKVDLLLANNFIKLPNATLNDNLSTTIDITLNKMIKNFSKEFKENQGEEIDKIRNESDTSTKYMLLTKLNKSKIADDAKGLKKQDGAFKKGVEKKNNVETLLNDKFNKVKSEVKEAQNINDKEKIKELLDEAKLLKEEAEENGDVFVSSDIDVLVDNLKEGKEGKE